MRVSIARSRPVRVCLVVVEEEAEAVLAVPPEPEPPDDMMYLLPINQCICCAARLDMYVYQEKKRNALLYARRKGFWYYSTGSVVCKCRILVMGACLE
mmetsp:Transcript_23130/g.48206  ORF Transcript_23130/g.48206 Transcript_23130/m.48206 type:complete len:98 (+) Transcript_23130:2-295(+)